METIFYFFVKTLDGKSKEDPIFSQTFLGEIGEHIIIDNVKYIIDDYAMDQFNLEEELKNLSNDYF